MKTLLLTSLLLCLKATLACAENPATPAAPASTVTHLTAPAAAQSLAAAAASKDPAQAITIIDVRTPEEFAQAHLKGAQNLDIASPDFKQNLAKLDPAKTYLVHCAAGGRSTRTLSLMSQLNFKSILHLDGGLFLPWWSKRGTGEL